MVTTAEAPNGAQELVGLVEGCRLGSSDAWSEMYRKHNRLVCSVARKMRLNDAETADVAQSVWMRFYEHIDDIREPAAVKSWLVTTTRREVFATMRKRPDTTALDFDVATNHQPSPDERAIDHEEREAMSRAWSRLRRADQLVLDVLVLDGTLDYERAAAQLERPIGSLGPTRQRALRRLRQIYDQELMSAGRGRRVHHR
jgi:RNA polymerase sigma factor (sigma-70 family)